MFPEAAVLSAEELRVGLSARFERLITEDDVYAFARISGDANPLHIDPEYAGRTHFAGCIVHGAFQVGLASALIGMHLPGRNVLLGAINAKFPAPLHYPCRVSVAGEVTSWNPESRAGGLKVTVRDVASQAPTAEMHLGFTLHTTRVHSTTVAALPASTGVRHAGVRHDGRQVVLVTGAAGGIGLQVVANLAGRYAVVAMVRRGALDGEVGARPHVRKHVREFVGDLQDAAWKHALTDALRGRRLYGVVHAAWAGQPHGGLLQVEPEVLEQQLNFGVLSTTELARFLFTQSAPDEGDQGGRMIVLGSIAATHKPVLPLASYSLGKAALEHAVRLLAPELARRKITINVVSPSFIATGMNKQSTDRQQMKEAALVPLGRLCQTDDVVELTRFLLSREASFISGQVIGLTGAQL